MAKFIPAKEQIRKSVKQNNASSGKSAATDLQRVRKNIYRQAILALLTVALTVVILFAMTSAWYTNIAQTSGLTFETEAWGFDGVITVDENAIQAAPGDNGYVQLTVENTSDDVSSVSVNVSKTGMEREMQRRLFFYVDTRQNRNDEIMDRVYLNKYEGYTYNVFSKGQLTLTEQVSNAPAIKWEWVYDVLGYYVLGQPQTTTKDGETTTKMDIKEYLRPISYDFDEATTVINTEEDTVSVDLETVDGTTKPEEFLIKLSEKDGYEGTIKSSDKLADTDYYAVDVDENGYGVYAYLCNYTEIKLATDYDTMLGELAKRAQAEDSNLTSDDTKLLFHKATLTLSAQKNENVTVKAATLGALQNAIGLEAADVIQLTGNVTITQDNPLTIPGDANVMIDLNGHTLTSLGGTAIQAEPGSSLTMIGGTLEKGNQEGVESPTKTYGIYATGAEVVMSDVDVNDFRYGIYMGDNENENELDSRVYMVDCNIDAGSYAVFISGNGLRSEQKSQLIIERSTLSSEGIVITGNGDTSGSGRWGTDIQIIESTITAKSNGAGIYQPQKNSTLNVYKSKVEGYNGIAIKGGSVSIVDSEISGTGLHMAPAFGGSGFTDTGDAVYIETNYDYEILLEISGNSVLKHTDANSKSLRVFEKDAKDVQVKIYGGTFDEEQPEVYIAENSIQNTTGTKFVVTAVQTEQQ